MAAKDSTRIFPAQPSPHSHKGDTILSLYELIENYIPTARPLMSVAELRIVLRLEQQKKENL